MEATWAKNFPRLYDLYCESDQHNGANYFATLPEELENPYARPHYERLEKDLRQLGDEAWRELKDKVKKDKYVTVKNQRRGHVQLFDLLGEVKGYLYLKSEGCTEIHFIPVKNSQTPDLYGRCGSSVILLEVKTINKSDDEIDWIRANSELRNGRMQAREARKGLDDLLKGKVITTINAAKKQLMNYACNGVQRKIVYLVIGLDILFALDKRNVVQLVAYIQSQGDKQIEVMHCWCDW